MGLVQNLITEPIRRRSPALSYLRIWQLVQAGTNGALAGSYVALSRLWRPRAILPQSPQLSGDACAAVVSELRRDGFALMQFRLLQSEIDALKTFAFSTPAYGNNPSDVRSFDEKTIPHDVGRFTWRVGDVIRHPVVQKLILEGPYCSIAQDYLGCRPQLVTVTLWLNPPFKGYGANSYHYDNDGPGFLKFFVLLTDMAVGTGAHYFVKGSHERKKPQGVAAPRLYEEDKIFQHYERSKEFVAGGPAGTIFAEDTAGFHRGSDLLSGYRLLLQLQFSVIDIPTDEQLDGSLEAVAVPALDPAVQSITSKFYRRKG